MDKQKIISIILGIIMIIIATIMPFHLKQICYEYSLHQEWSLGSWNAVQISAAIYSIIICAFSLILILVNVRKKSN